MRPLTAQAADDAALFFALMDKLGLPSRIAALYLRFLQGGAVSRNELCVRGGMLAPELDAALACLLAFRLVSEDVLHGCRVFYACDPRIAWKAHDVQFYWLRSSYVGDIEDYPPLPSQADEARRGLYAQLEGVCGRIRDQAAVLYDPLHHRHRDIASDALYSCWLTQAIASAKSRIEVVDMAPRRPELAPEWVALTRRMRAGVTYTRVIDGGEVLEHGLGIVASHMQRYGIDLRIIPRADLSDAFCIIDDRLIMVRNVRGAARADRPPHFGTYTSQHHIVRRHAERFQEHYRERSVPASALLEALRRQVDRNLSRLRAQGRGQEAEALRQVAELGKFAPPRPATDPALAWLSAEGYVERNADGHVVLAASVP